MPFNGRIQLCRSPVELCRSYSRITNALSLGGFINLVSGVQTLPIPCSDCQANIAWPVRYIVELHEFAVSTCEPFVAGGSYRLQSDINGTYARQRSSLQATGCEIEYRYELFPPPIIIFYSEPNCLGVPTARALDWLIMDLVTGQQLVTVNLTFDSNVPIFPVQIFNQSFSVGGGSGVPEPGTVATCSPGRAVACA